MVTFSRKIDTLDDLRYHINKVLCDQEQLLLGAFEMTERLLTRGGKPCGMYFCVHGPRSVRISAVWDAHTGTVLFTAPAASGSIRCSWTRTCSSS
jgi:hypothetical protein